METLHRALGVTLIIFMVGNLLQMGLKLDIGRALGALCHVRFVTWTLVWSFVLCPGLAWLLTRLIPLAEPYAVGLLFLGTAPCAPFLPAVAARARGDLSYVAASLLLASAGTVLYMPFSVPVLVEGFTASAWTIARPLICFITVPLVLGIAIQSARASFAARLHPAVGKIAAVDTLVMVALVLVLYGRDFLGAVGSYAIGTQLLYLAVVTIAAYGSGSGLAECQRSVLALGACTRNIGAAIAPLFAVPGTDRRAIAMVALAVPTTVLTAWLAAVWFARRASVEPVSDA